MIASNVVEGRGIEEKAMQRAIVNSEKQLNDGMETLPEVCQLLSVRISAPAACMRSSSSGSC